MGVLSDYRNYKQFEPQYKDWKKNKDLAEQKRLEYLRQNPLTEAQKKECLQRGEAIIDAIDTMDEFSQTKAEDMEVATEAAVGQGISMVSVAGSILGFGLAFLPPVRKFIEKSPKLAPHAELMLRALPIIAPIPFAAASAIPLYAWASKKQIEASRNGRFEAMRDELSSAKKFVTLTDEQKEEVEKKAKDIPQDKSMKKSQDARLGKGLGIASIFSAAKDLMSPDEELEQEREAFDDSLYKMPLTAPQLSAKDLENAKTDKQVLSNLVEKIDIASQDYAEDVELATGAAMIVAPVFMLGGSALVSKAFSKANLGVKAKIASWTVGIVGSVAAAIVAAKLQKQASRVGRFKVKQEMLKNPENFAFVDDEKLNSIKDVEYIEKPKKSNIFKFLAQVWEENKEYKAHIKETLIEKKKFEQAKDSLEYSPEQMQRAKTLQKNTFKIFNKVDEKSQAYSENVEAVGQMLDKTLNIVVGGVGSIFTLVSMVKNPPNIDLDSNPMKGMGKTVLKAMIPAFAMIPPALALNYYFTKEQKKASRVADMLAIEEMGDHKNFVDYENLALDNVSFASQKSHFERFLNMAQNEKTS